VQYISFPPSLKVHKNGNLFGSDFEFCTFSLLVLLKYKILGKKNFDWTILGGAMIVPSSLKTKRNQRNFQYRPKKFFSYMTLLYWLIIDFEKFDSNTATGMALCVNLGPKCQKIFPLVSD
jgi:hypothetical protein